MARRGITLARGVTGEHGGWLATWVLAMSIFALLWVAPAAADVRPFEVNAYSDQFNVSEAVAENRLEVQSRGTEADIVGEMEQALGGSFAGVWFDNETGEFVVPVASSAGRALSADRADVSRELADVGLVSRFRTPAVEHSWRELEKTQAVVNLEIRDLFEANLVQTSIDPNTNAVVVDVAKGISEDDAARLNAISGQSDIDIELRDGELQRFRARSLIDCHAYWRYCGTPLRGGVVIDSLEKAWCTSAFRVRGDTNNKRYLLTAGHCIGNGQFPYPGQPYVHWSSSLGELAKDDKFQERYIGEVEQWAFPGNDWAKINATGSFWDTSPWPARVVRWGENQATIVQENYPIEAEGSSYMWQTVCHSGGASGTSCAVVTALNQSIFYGTEKDPEGMVNGLTVAEGGCAYPGDSGGAVFASNQALGILSGGAVWETEDGELHPCADPDWFYREITDATSALNAHIAFPSIASINASWLNGMPGSIRATGSVSAGGNPVSGSVNVEFRKLEGGQWVLKNTVPTPVASGSYDTGNVTAGTGTWRVKTVVPAQEWVEPSESEVREVTVKATAWYSDNLGGYILDDPDISSWGNGRLDVFALGADGKTMFHKWYSGGAWSGWETRTTGYSSGPGAVSWGNNRIDVVGRATNGSVAHEYWDGSWHKDNLGGYILDDPDISSWGYGRLDVFALGADGKTLFHKWFTAAEGWSGWETRTTGYTSSPSAVSWGNGRIDVVGRATNGSVAHEYWDGSWHKDNLGGYTLSAPDISSWGNGRLDVFALGADGKTMFHKWFTAAEGWSDWEPRGSGYASGPGAVSWGYNRIDVIGRATNGSIKHEFWAP